MRTTSHTNMAHQEVYGVAISFIQNIIKTFLYTGCFPDEICTNQATPKYIECLSFKELQPSIQPLISYP